MMTRSFWIVLTIAAILGASVLLADAQPAQTRPPERPPSQRQPTPQQPAQRQPTPQQPAQRRPTPQQLAQAKAHFDAAENAKRAGNHQLAVTEYLAAYKLFPDPEFHFNVAEAYRLAGDEQSALSYYESYLALDPHGRGAPTARARVDQIRQAQTTTQQAASPTPAEAEPMRTAEDEAGQQAAERARRDEEQRHEITAQAAKRGRTMRIAGMATGGAGVVSLGIGVMFGLKARAISDEISNADMFDQRRYDEGERADRNLLLFTGVGAAAAITGGVLYYLGHRAGRTATDTALTFAPIVAPSQIAVTASGRF
jgi:tetratricopeptide (TPR) repeat protein